MHMIKVGVHYGTAPLDIRERLNFSETAAKQAMTLLQAQDAILENVILSTCNRTEVYAVVEDVAKGRKSIQQFLGEWFQMDQEVFVPFLATLENEAAIDHLFKLAAGLDSMVIGETQILGQVRQAFLTAQQLKTTSKYFNELFKRVITFAKRAHRDTGIGEQAVSISYVAVELSKKIFGTINDKHVVILGAGETGELTLKNLQGAGVSKITIMNRTLEKARELADQFQAAAAPIESLTEVLREADVLISSTASPAPILTKEGLMPVQKQRKGHPLFLIDIAVPRDIDPDIAQLDNIFLYDIDDLQTIVNENVAKRKKAAAVIENKLVAEFASFHHWLAMQDAIPVIRALQEKSAAIQERTLESIYRKMPDLDEREMKVLQKHTKSIVHQILEEPIKRAKDMSVKGNAKDSLALFKTIFGLEDDKMQQQETHD